VAALHAAFRFGQPEIWNSDQGAQFTSADFLAPLKKRGISISMDGRGRALDNVFIERLWRSLKYSFGMEMPNGLERERARMDVTYRKSVGHTQRTQRRFGNCKGVILRFDHHAQARGEVITRAALDIRAIT
jgi:transposase InsO family protein